MEKVILQPSYKEIPLGLTFDDVLLIPQYSNIKSRFDINIKSKFSKNINLNIPIISSPMDTVTETEMAIEMARNGGIGIIHRFCSIQDQVNMIYQVKSTESNIIDNPITVSKTMKLKDLKKLSQQLTINTFLVGNKQIDNLVNEDINLSNSKKNHNVEKLEGIITSRDFFYQSDLEKTVEQLMTPRDKLHVYQTHKPQQKERIQVPKNEFFYEEMIMKKIEKIPIVSFDNEILGLITLKDILRNKERPLASLDDKGQLLVAASIGVKEDDFDRAHQLIEAGCNAIIVDIANGHSQTCIDAVKQLKDNFKIDVIAGSIATAEGAEMLIKAGADGIRCGIGNGSICITRIVAGSGVPQLSALFDVQQVCKQYGVPLIADGGIKNSGDMCKALAAGADTIMIGKLLAGCDESPSRSFNKDGKLVKIYRGMAGYGANLSKTQRTGENETQTTNYTPEGVEGYISYSGPLRNVLFQFTTGIRSGMSYSGAINIAEFQKKAKFTRMTQSGLIESHAHINQLV